MCDGESHHAGIQVDAGRRLCVVPLPFRVQVIARHEPLFMTAGVQRKPQPQCCDRPLFLIRHCEERSYEAIQSVLCGLWIASLRSQ
jgi:hypothetical protein